MSLILILRSEGFQPFSVSIMAEHIGEVESGSGDGAVAQWLPSAVTRLVRVLIYVKLRRRTGAAN